MSNLLCKLGWHRPLKRHIYSFTDVVSGKAVYNAECPCGLKWKVDSMAGLRGYKVCHRNQAVKQRGEKCSFCEKRTQKLTCLDNEVISDMFVCNKCLKKIKGIAK